MLLIVHACSYCRQPTVSYARDFPHAIRLIGATPTTLDPWVLQSDDVYDSACGRCFGP